MFNKSIIIKLIKSIIIFLIFIFIGFTIYLIPNISLKFNNILDKNCRVFSNKDNNDDITEIMFSPVLLENESFVNPSDISNFDLTLGIIKKNEGLNLNSFSKSITLIADDDKNLLNNDIHILNTNHFYETSIENNFINYMYLDKDLSSPSEISTYKNIIKRYKTKKGFIVIYISSKARVTKNTLDFLCDEGVNIIFSPALNNTSIEKNKSSVIIYGVENFEECMPQFDLIFQDNNPIALGIKLHSNGSKNDKEYDDIIKNSKNFAIDLSKNFSYIDY